MKNKISLLVLMALFLLSVPEKVYAYLDPGTGSYVLQVLVASLLGAGVMVGSYRKKIKSFIDKILKK
jgi:hypothetical protein